MTQATYLEILLKWGRTMSFLNDLKNRLRETFMPGSVPTTLKKAQTRYLRRPVTIRKHRASYSAGYNHVHPDGSAKAIRPSPVYFLGYAGDNKGWCYIYYTYNGKTYYGYIHKGNFTEDSAGVDYTNEQWDANRRDTLDNEYNQPSTEGSGGSQESPDASSETSSSTEQTEQTTIVSSSDTSIPTHLTRFTNPTASLGANYAVYSPVPDPNAENELISSKYHYEEPFNIFVLPGYTPARMTIYTYVDNKQVVRSFEFLVGPSNMTESNANSIIPLKTGAGFFLLRNGAELGRMTVSGYFLESDAVDERRLFMEDFYRSYMIDKVNTFHSYFNESSLYLELEGYRYQCILQNLDLAKAVDSLFLFRYSMSLLVLSQEITGTVRRPSTRNGKISQSPGKIEAVRGAAGLLNKAVSM